MIEAGSMAEEKGVKEGWKVTKIAGEGFDQAKWEEALKPTKEKGT